MKYNNVYLSIGSNIGNKYYNILKAIFSIDQLKETKVLEISSFYKTEPIGTVVQDDFLNIAILIRTKQKPYELLKNINLIEEKLKRKRKIHWGPRTIDIDIIFYEERKLNKRDLIVPHKEYKNRNFVMVPILEILRNKNIRFELLKNIDYKKGKIKKVSNDNPILISSCLYGVNCKYNGDNNYDYLINKLAKKINFILICPEILGGLSTPRVPVEIYNKKAINRDGVDCTEQFKKGAKESLKIANKTKSEIAIMKLKSPSCGMGKIYDGTFNSKLVDGNGMTVEAFLKNDILIISR